MKLVNQDCYILLQDLLLKIALSHIDPLVINTALDSIHYKLRDLQKRVLLCTFHVNRLIETFVFTQYGTVKSQSQLTKAIQGNKSREIHLTAKQYSDRMEILPYQYAHLWLVERPASLNNFLKSLKKISIFFHKERHSFKKQGKINMAHAHGINNRHITIPDIHSNEPSRFKR